MLSKNSSTKKINKTPIPESLFAKISKSIKNRDSFSVERIHAREILCREFSLVPEENRAILLSNTFDWTTNALRLRSSDSRFIALLILSFIVEIDSDQPRLSQLSIDLDKLLPLDSIPLLEGIAFLFKRISENLNNSIITRIADRCIYFLSNRATQSAIQTAIVILSKLKPISKLSKNSTILWAAIKFPNKLIQEMAVDLYFLCLAQYPFSDDISKAMMSTSIVWIQVFSNKSETYGAFLVIRKFIEKNFDIIDEKFNDIYYTISNFLMAKHDPLYFEVFAMLCEMNPNKVKSEIDQLYKLMESNWDLNDSKICDSFVRVASLFPAEFGEISYRYAQNICEDSYFKLISIKSDCTTDFDEIINKFKNANLSDSLIESAYKFVQSFPHSKFKFTQIFIHKLDEALKSNNIETLKLSYKLIVKFENGVMFPFQNYWDPIFQSLKNSKIQNNIINNQNDLSNSQKKLTKNDSLYEECLLRTRALISIIKNDETEPERKLIDLLFFLQNFSSDLFCDVIDNVDDTLLPFFLNDPLRILVASYSSDLTRKVYFSVSNLFIKLRSFSPLSSLNFFINIFKLIPSTFVQYTSYSEKRKIMHLWTNVIDGAVDLVEPLSSQLYKFFISLIVTGKPPVLTFEDFINNRKNVKEVMRIHIYSMKCLDKLIQRRYPYNTQEIIDSLIAQLSLFQHESVHIAALNTLRSVIRSFGTSDFNMESLHNKLFDYVKIAKSDTTLSLILSVLGTIGPLDPISFHPNHNHVHHLPLYDKSKREQTYLDFVMKYLLYQLENSQESSVLLNAVLYIFQFDAQKSSVYLSDLIDVLEKLLNRGLDDSVFHIIRSIILRVEIEIFPHAGKIYSLLAPYLIIPNVNLNALKALSAIVFIMKSAFKPMAIKTFSMVLDILSEEYDSDFELYLMQILAHLVIYCSCSSRLFFKQIEKMALKVDVNTSYALNFLSQVILHTPDNELYLASINLGVKLMNVSDKTVRESAGTLLSILSEKYPDYIPHQFNAKSFVKEEKHCKITSDPCKSQISPSLIVPLSVSEILTKNNFMQYENNWDYWLLQLSQNLVLCSNSPAIRACHPLLQLWANFEHQLFPLILISVWEISKEEDRKKLSTILASVAQNPNTPVEILGIICDAIEAMDRAGYQLFDDIEGGTVTPSFSNGISNSNSGSIAGNLSGNIPIFNSCNIAGNIAMKCEHFFRAVRFFERTPIVDEDCRCQLIHVYARLQRREGALGIYNITPKAETDTSILQELGVWSQAINLFKPDSSENDFIEFIECCARVEDWETVMKYSNRFNSLTPEAKSSISIHFAAACTFFGLKDINQFLQYTTKSTPFQCIWQAVIALQLNKIKVARLFIERGKKLNASNRAPFLSGNYEPTLPVIELATFLEEINDIVDVREGISDASQVLDLWNSKSYCSKSDVAQLRITYIIRKQLEPNNQLKIGLSFIDAARKRKAYRIYDNSLNRIRNNLENELKNNEEDDNEKSELIDKLDLLIAKVRFDRKQCRDLHEVMKVIKTTKSESVFASAVCGYASRLQNPSPKILNLLHSIIEQNPNNLRALKHWTYGNLYCARKFSSEINTSASSPNLSAMSSHIPKPSSVNSKGSSLRHTVKSDIPLSPPLPTKRKVPIYDKVKHNAHHPYNLPSFSFTKKNYNVSNASSTSDLSTISNNDEEPDRKALFIGERSHLVSTFANNALQGFVDLVNRHSRPHLHYLCQLCSLCFSYNTDVKGPLKSLPPSSIEQIVQQLLAQFDHKRKSVRKYVRKIITKFAEDHIQALAFPLSYMNKIEKTKELSDFIDQFRKRHPRFTAEVRLITDSLLSITNLDFEMVSFLLEKACKQYSNDSDKDAFFGRIDHALSFELKTKQGINKKVFDKGLIKQAMDLIKKAISNYKTNKNYNQSLLKQQNEVQDTINIIKNLIGHFHTEIENIQALDINEIAPELIEQAPYSVACPGQYSVSRSTYQIDHKSPYLSSSTGLNSNTSSQRNLHSSSSTLNDPSSFSYPTIQSFSKIAKFMPSTKLPRKIRITGSDGHIYRYLLKGKEDLSLDQRVMQWFSLSNSLLRDDKSGIEKNLYIENYAIIPLSPLAGMIAWAEGGETLYKLISWYSHLKKEATKNKEEQLLDSFACENRFKTMALNFLQRLEYFEELCKITSNTLLREAIWIKSANSEIWFSQKTNFARSNGLMSIVGYIIGLGDRHPSNILFMNKTGNAAHIDFSECFEKAHKRDFYPEKVPFRLTRMMVKALGESGVEGDFRMTAEFVMSLMRKNKSALLAFLDIFAKGQDIGVKQEDFDRIYDKLNGCEFEGEKELSVETQVGKLIHEATSPWNLSRMFVGWAPQW